MTFNRRQFLKTLGAASAAMSLPMTVKAAAMPRVVVLGGGFAGASVAKYLRAWSDKTIEVVMVDPNAAHTSCVLSNLVLNNRISLNELTLSYSSLSSFYGVDVMRDRAAEIDGTGKRVRLNDAGWIDYDHLVIATGIDFVDIPGLDFNLTPHAWVAGPQTQLLASQVSSLGPSSTFIMTIPPSPYRCPPGPYERACVVADILKRKGYNNGDARVVVLDANPSIQAERHTFEQVYSQLYRNIIDYVPNATLNAVDSQQRIVDTGAGEYRGDVVNVIAPQQAMGFVRESGLTGSGLWAGVDPLTYASTQSGFDGVHIIGDAQATGQPKSAHMANSQAKVCADAIIRIINGISVTDPERVANITTNSACYSPVSYDQASWLTANFSYDETSRQMMLKHLGEAERWSKDNYEEMFAWASNLFTDSFH